MIPLEILDFIRAVAARMHTENMHDETKTEHPDLSHWARDIRDKSHSLYEGGSCIRAYVLSTSEKAALDMLRLPDQHALIKSMFKHTQVYTHVDVYSPPPEEDLLFRVTL